MSVTNYVKLRHQIAQVIDNYKPYENFKSNDAAEEILLLIENEGYTICKKNDLIKEILG